MYTAKKRMSNVYKGVFSDYIPCSRTDNLICQRNRCSFFVTDIQGFHEFSPASIGLNLSFPPVCLDYSVYSCRIEIDSKFR